jgi:hypothetical protein
MLHGEFHLCDHHLFWYFSLSPTNVGLTAEKIELKIVLEEYTFLLIDPSAKTEGFILPERKA